MCVFFNCRVFKSHFFVVFLSISLRKDSNYSYYFSSWPTKVLLSYQPILRKLFQYGRCRGLRVDSYIFHLCILFRLSLMKQRDSLIQAERVRPSALHGRWRKYSISEMCRCKQSIAANGSYAKPKMTNRVTAPNKTHGVKKWQKQSVVPQNGEKIKTGKHESWSWSWVEVPFNGLVTLLFQNLSKTVR